MNDKKTKLITYLTAFSVILSGCKMSLENLFNKDKAKQPIKDTNASVTTPSNTQPPYEEILETIIESTISETIEPTNNITIETEPTINETEPSEVTEEPTISSEEIIQNKIVKENQVVTSTTTVNIRTSNTTDSMIIGNLNISDKAINIISCDNNWCLIKTNELIGYVCSDYLDVTDEIIESEYKHTKYEDIVVTKTELNFRTAPTTEAKKISRFAKNTELHVVAKTDNGWLLVKHNGILGYVHGDYIVSLLELAKLEYPETDLENLNIEKVVYVDASELNIRKGPNTEYEKIGSLSKYESIRVIKEFDDWYFIMTNEYTFGFIV